MSVTIDDLELSAPSQSQLALKWFLSRSPLLCGKVFLRFLLLLSQKVLAHIFLNLCEGLVLYGESSLVHVLDWASAAALRSWRHPARACEASLDLQLFGKTLYPADGVTTHHHFLLGEAILEELLDLDTWSKPKQIITNVESSLHELVIVKVNGVWVNLLRVKVVFDVIWGIKQRVVKYFHENSWMTIESPATTKRSEMTGVAKVKLQGKRLPRKTRQPTRQCPIT